MDDWNENGIMIGKFERKMNYAYGRFIYRYTYLACLLPMPIYFLALSIKFPNWYNDIIFQITALLVLIFCLFMGAVMNHGLSRSMGGVQIYQKGIQMKRSTFDRISKNKRFYPISSVSSAVYKIVDITGDRKEIVGDHRSISLRMMDGKKMDMPMLDREGLDQLSLILSRDLRIDVTLDDQRKSSRVSYGSGQNTSPSGVPSRADQNSRFCSECGNSVPLTDDYCMHCGRSIR